MHRQRCRQLHSEPTRDVDKSFNRLNQNADAKGEEEDAIEESAEKLGSLPSESVALGGGFGSLRDLTADVLASCTDDLLGR